MACSHSIDIDNMDKTKERQTKHRTSISIPIRRETLGDSLHHRRLQSIRLELTCLEGIPKDKRQVLSELRLRFVADGGTEKTN